MAKQNRNHNISRIDNLARGAKHPVRGWEVRIYRRGQRFNQFFSDSVHGGKLKALEEARKVRDKTEKKLKPYTRRELAERCNKRNTSGVRGVRVRTTIVTKNGKTYRYEHVEASWSSEPGKVIKKNFSVEKLGKDAAWAAAVECRRKAVSKFR